MQTRQSNRQPNERIAVAGVCFGGNDSSAAWLTVISEARGFQTIARLRKVIAYSSENLNSFANFSGPVPMQQLFVVRDAEGHISGLFPPNPRPMPRPRSIDDPEVQAFPYTGWTSTCPRTEDVIDLLVASRVPLHRPARIGT